VESGQFHIHIVRTIDQGMEILTGMAPGVRNSQGAYPAGTVNYLVEKRLKEMAYQIKDFGGN